MRVWFVLGVAATLAVSFADIGSAHPSRGLVAGSDKSVFFSDLERIWMIDPRGRLSMIRGRSGGHTHELFLDRSGNVYGEDSFYENGRYTSALWQRDRSGRFRFVFGPAANPPLGLGVVRDSRDCTYQSDRTPADQQILYRRCPGRPPVRLTGVAGLPRNLLSNIAGAAMGPDGFYFRRGSTVQRVAGEGEVRIVATGLSAENFGLAVGADRSIFVAEHRNKRIVRVQPSGRRSVVAVASGAWAPTGVALSGSTIFVLEASSGSPTRMRVRAIQGGRERLLAVVP